MKKLLTYGLAALLMTVTALAQSLHRIKDDVLAAYSKEDFSTMMDLYALKDTDAVKKMVSEGKVVGLRKGAEVYLESVDMRTGQLGGVSREARRKVLITLAGICGGKFNEPWE